MQQLWNVEKMIRKRVVVDEVLAARQQLRLAIGILGQSGVEFQAIWRKHTRWLQAQLIRIRGVAARASSHDFPHFLAN